MKINVIKQKIEPDNIGLKPNKFYYCDYYGGYYEFLGAFDSYSYRHHTDDEHINISKFKLYYFKKLLSPNLKPSILIRSIPASLVRKVTSEEQKIIDETLLDPKIKEKFASKTKAQEENFLYQMKLSESEFKEFNNLAKIVDQKCTLVRFEEEVFSKFKPVGFYEDFNYELKVFYDPTVTAKIYGGVDFVVTKITLKKK